jgi:hypothetical protein
LGEEYRSFSSSLCSLNLHEYVLGMSLRYLFGTGNKRK